MRKAFVLVVSVFFFLTSCTKQAYEGAVVGGAAGSVIGAVLDEENPWRGAFIGGITGAVITGTIVEISSKAADECVEYDKPVVYRCYRCKENVWIRAVPLKRKGRCRKVKLFYYKGDTLIKTKIKRVCIRKRHHH